jgi:hypothetical protein
MLFPLIFGSGVTAAIMSNKRLLADLDTISGCSSSDGDDEPLTLRKK